MADLAIALVLGTRPEIIKLAPVIRACEREDIDHFLLHTGQHYSESLDRVFFEQLNLPTPEYNLDIGSGSHGRQTAGMISGIESILEDERPDVVLVQGDTNTVLAGTIAADKLPTRLGHVEAGLRSFDREMPEESNRRVADHLSDYLFAPTERSANLLAEEGIDDERVFVTGNTVVDAVEQNRTLALEKSTVLSDLGLDPGNFVLLTAHRQETVDAPERFASVLRGADAVASSLSCPVVYPIHPRSRERLSAFGIDVPETVRLLEPREYLDFLKLESEATLVLTDSGGVQEEACILGTPCVTLRDSTERPETIEVGANRLVGTDPDEIRRGSRIMIETATEWDNPFGNGSTGESIVSILRSNGTVRGETG